MRRQLKKTPLLTYYNGLEKGFNMARRKKSKEWFKSKTVWFNTVVTVIESSVFLQSAISVLNDQIDPITMLYIVFGLAVVKGIGNIILRVWFTKESIK
jgi:hypothetical protein